MAIETSTTILTLLAAQALSQPDTIALTFLHNGETPTFTLTYRQLLHQAHTIATHLLHTGVVPGERVLLVYEEGLAFLPAFLGCLYVGAIAVPAPAPDTLRGKRTLPHLQTRCTDAQASLVLTTEALRPQLGLGPTLPSLATDTLASDAPVVDTFPTIHPQQLAYLQYSSGSTGMPKGVMISHANLLANLMALHQAGPYTSDCVTLTWMPHTHDFGLVEGLLRPLSAGIPCYVMSPWSFLRRPLRWLTAISTLRITHSSGAAFAYQHCLDQIDPTHCTDLDLRCWRATAVGAEVLRATMLEEFTRTFAPYGFAATTFCPAYGLAESTLMATVNRVGDGPRTCVLTVEGRATVLTGCGQPWGDSKVVVVDPITQRPLPAGEIGEIWLAGGSVAQGYWNQPQATQESFGAQLEGQTYLRTGDLGLFEDNTLFISGRLKDLIIVHGQNYYPQDIEWCLETAHPLLKGGGKAAFAIAAPDRAAQAECVIIVCEVDPRPSAKTTDLAEVIQAIRAKVATDFALTVYGVSLIRRGTLPKTPSGKVQRRACRTTWRNGELESLVSWHLDSQDLTTAIVAPLASSPTFVAPRTSTEQALTQLWGELLEIDQISMDDNFFALGGSSLLIIRLIGQIEQRWQVRLPLESFVFEPTIAHLASQMDALHATGQFATPPRVPEPVSAQPLHPSNLQQLYEKLGQPNAYRQLRRSNQRPSTLMRAKSKLTGLLQPTAVPVLRQLVRQPWAQQRYWSTEVALIRRFHSTLDTSVSVTTLIENSLLYNLLPLYGFHRRRLAADQITGSEPMLGLNWLEERQHPERGIILATHHSLQMDWPHVDKLTQMVIFEINSLLRQSQLNAKMARPVLYARQLEVAHQVLQNGGVVTIVADGNNGNSKGRILYFHGRQRRFRTTFAELALLTGASIIPMLNEIQEDGSRQLRLLPPLDTGDETMSYHARVVHLSDQYVAHLDHVWRTIPWTIPWRQMQKHLAYPE